MYNHKLILADQMFEDGQTVPANTTDDADVGLRAKGTGGRLAVVFTAKTACVVKISAVWTFVLKTIGTEDGSYAAIAPVMTIVKTEAASEKTYAVGDVIIRIPVPDDYIDKWIKPNVGTDDAGATGTMNVFLEYLGS